MKVLIAGGGTGGHLFPAFAIADSLSEIGSEVEFVGSMHGLEKEMSKHRKEPYHLLDVRGIQRSFSMHANANNLIFPWRFLFSLIKSIKIIRNFRPDVVVGTGGYSSGLPLLAALIMGIPTLIQEQNSYPGITSRVLGKYVKLACTAFPEAEAFFPKRVAFTGNPVRKMHASDKASARRSLGLEANKFTIFVTGGSQGSRPINQHILANLEFYSNPEIQVLWQCGKRDAESLQKNNFNKNIHIQPFILDMSGAFSSADIVISRAGAMSVSELCLLGKAAVFIPFPHAAGDHQRKNAESMANAGAAKWLHQSELSSGKLEKLVEWAMEHPKEIAAMEAKSLALAKPQASAEIVSHIREIAC